MTEFLTVVVIAVALAMDAFAVSVATGSVYRKLHLGHALRMAFFFGLFQAFMPLLGYLAGEQFKAAIQAYDHWIASTLLFLIGGRMVYEIFQMAEAQEESNRNDPTSLAVVLMLSVATSIDALAVGVTLSLVVDHVYWAAAGIGLITFGMSLVGCLVGQKIGHFFEKKIEALGGLILIGIGAKILIEHLLSGK